MSAPHAGADVNAMTTSGTAFKDPAALSALRRDAFESAGPQYGIGILYGLGFAEGMFDGLRVVARFQSGSGPPLPASGAALPMVFQPDEGRVRGCFAGSLTTSEEAVVHLRDYAAAADPICFASAGYAAGWYSAILDETILVREVRCVGCGAAHCRFEAQRLEAWLAQGGSWLDDIVPYLDFDAIRTRAQARVDCAQPIVVGPAPGEEAGDMMGGFDAMSPAVHVWGPVMILPYSGADDCLVALETIYEDLGPDQVRVVVIDATGASIDAVEAIGLARLLNVLHAQNLETVLVGVGEQSARYFDAHVDRLTAPILARGLSEAITLGFQMSLASR